MPRNSSTGVYEAPTNSVNPAVANQVISSTDFNAMLTDVETALSTTDATTRALWARAGQVQDDAINWCGTAGGTADVLTLTPAVPLTAYVTGGRFAFLTGGSANTTVPTINVSGLGARTLTRRDGTTVTGGDLPASSMIEIRYDGTNFRLTSITPSTIGGGATSTTTAASFALTASSNRVQSVTFTAASQSVTLPNATTLSVGGPSFIISNAGARTFGVRANGGGLLTAVPPGAVCDVSLIDNSTAAGTWNVGGTGIVPALPIADHTFASTYTTASQVAVRLSDTLSLHFVRDASGFPYVVAADHSTAPATVGTPVLIASSNVDVEHAFRISATKAAFNVAGTASNVYNVAVSGTTCTVSPSATAAVFDAATFTGEPLIAALGANFDLFVAIDTTGTTVRAQAVDCSGTNPSAGASVNVSALGTGSVVALGCYRIDNTTALAIYIDDSGSAGTPFSIRAVVLSLSGTTVTVNTPAGLNDVTAAVALPTCQLSATSYVVGFLDATNSDISAVHIGVSGTTVTFGAKFAAEVGTISTDPTYTRNNAGRFQPNLFPLSATTALFTWDDNTNTRHAILTNSAGTLTRGDILYRVWQPSQGGNFTQAADGFLACDDTPNNNRVVAVTIGGTSMSVTGTFRVPAFVPAQGSATRFGLSGGIRAVTQEEFGSESFFLLHVFRFRAGGPPQYLGQYVPNNVQATTARVPVEVAPSRVAWSGIVRSQSVTDPASTAMVNLQIWEFPA